MERKLVVWIEKRILGPLVWPIKKSNEGESFNHTLKSPSFLFKF